MIKRRLFSAGLLVAPFVKPAFAQAWQPSGPIRMVVAYPAGGPTDVIARIIAETQGRPPFDPSLYAFDGHDKAVAVNE